MITVDDILLAKDGDEKTTKRIINEVRYNSEGLDRILYLYNKFKTSIDILEFGDVECLFNEVLWYVISELWWKRNDRSIEKFSSFVLSLVERRLINIYNRRQRKDVFVSIPDEKIHAIFYNGKLQDEVFFLKEEVNRVISEIKSRIVEKNGKKEIAKKKRKRLISLVEDYFLVGLKQDELVKKHKVSATIISRDIKEIKQVVRTMKETLDRDRYFDG